MNDNLDIERSCVSIMSLCVTGTENGNQFLTINGNGFPADAEVKLCGNSCPVVTSMSTSTTLVCITPPGTGLCPSKSENQKTYR